MRYSCVERAGPTLCIRRRSLCASGFLCMPKTVRGARRMNVHARRTPAMRRARWTNARHTRGTRGAHAGHTRGTRWSRVVCSSTDVQRTPSAPWAHTQRASKAGHRSTLRPYVRRCWHRASDYVRLFPSCRVVYAPTLFRPVCDYVFENNAYVRK